jgi:hypothetical protein
MEGKSHRDSLRDNRAADQELTHVTTSQPRISNRRRTGNKNHPCPVAFVIFGDANILESAKTGKN